MARFAKTAVLTVVSVALLCSPTSASATNETLRATDRTQQPLLNTDCLPGPFQHANFPACFTGPNPDDASSFAPWTHRPYCPPNTTYCVFTNADFQGPGRGVSIIDEQPPKANANTTPAVFSISRLLSSAPIHTQGPKHSSPSYEVRDIPGKGKGLVATRKIRRGEVFMVDYVAVVADGRFPTRVRRAQGRRLLAEAIERLPMGKEVLSLARSSSDPENVPAVEDVMKTNSFSVEIDGGEYMALFPRIARMNHACKPSALTHFNSTTLSNTVTAFRDILPNEEITISYTPFNLPSPARHTALLQKWGFTCTCALCTSPPSLLAASDKRRTTISRLGDKVVKLVSKGNPEALRRAAEMYEEVVHAAEREEGLVPHMGGHYEVLGRLWIAAGEGERGVGWVRRGREEERGFEEGGA
ncbi:SET domain-containing protein 5 [Staphylotrichum tortipilum]|uniref:SET domain-containing protein 5 n=1 Tax=Staphylotrichum tortipilum TaxID=2831512 RepID=A0AAN6MQI3_9PEZI|nr:SET domain-containing protein 5 [Staphylotrichum longicolle]